MVPRELHLFHLDVDLKGGKCVQKLSIFFSGKEIQFFVVLNSAKIEFSLILQGKKLLIKKSKNYFLSNENGHFIKNFNLPRA